MSKLLPLSILQWNMGDSPYAKGSQSEPEKRAEALSSLLNENKPAIVTLQETSDSILTKTVTSGYELMRGPAGLAMLFRKESYILIDQNAFRDRVQVMSLDTTPTRTNCIHIINMHLPIVNRTPEDRRDFARTILAECDKWRIDQQDRLEIIAGDFNLPPYDEVIVGRQNGFFANRDSEHVKRDSGSLGRGLFNTSWHIFGGQCGALGTYYYNNLPHGPWHIPDQVMLDPRLLTGNSLDVRVITSTSGISFTTPRTKHPNKKSYSDHFPVLVSIMPSGKM